MVVHHTLQTDLKRKRDFTGRRTRIWNSSTSSGIMLPLPTSGATRRRRLGRHRLGRFIYPPSLLIQTAFNLLYPALHVPTNISSQRASTIFRLGIETGIILATTKTSYVDQIRTYLYLIIIKYNINQNFLPPSVLPRSLRSPYGGTLIHTARQR